MWPLNPPVAHPQQTSLATFVITLLLTTCSAGRGRRQPTGRGGQKPGSEGGPGFLRLARTNLFSPRYILSAARRRSRADHRMNVDIVIPTINSARWLGQLLDGYRTLGIEPLYALDSRCDDGSLELLRARGARIIRVHQQGFHVENGILAQISPHVERDWILRLDDDEFPSAALLKWAAQTTAPADILSWYLPRLTLYRDEGRIKYSRVKTHYHNYPHSRLIDPQCRLYRHRD